MHRRHRSLLAITALGACLALTAGCTVAPEQTQTTDTPVIAKSEPPSPTSDPCQAPEVAKQGEADLTVIPKPAEATALKGDGYELTDASAIGVINADDELAGPATYLADIVNPATGLSLKVSTDPTGHDAPIRFCLDENAKPESYAIQASKDGIWITAADQAGAFDAVTTLRQLLPDEIESSEPADATWSIPAISITDRPRYRYRAVMIDVARSFYTVDDLKKVIDTASLYKLNYLRLHLTDDQGWRIAIPDYPKLTEEAASYQSGGKHGGPWFYTREQYQDIVTYAASRGIGVIPEIDGPGHVNAAQSAYGDLTCDGKTTEPYTGHDVGFSMYCLTDQPHIQDVTSFLTSVWQELAGLTPAGIMHAGGDEAMKATPQTYGQYVSIVSEIAQQHKMRLMAWHQFGNYDLPKNAILQYWGTAAENRSIGGAESAYITELRNGLKQNAAIVMSPADRTYMDMCFDTSTPVGTSWAGCHAPKDAYDWDPATFVAPSGGGSIIPAKSIMGVEATLFADHLYKGWTDKSESNFVAPIDYFGYMSLPRLPALAEVAWSAQDARDWADMEPRLTAQEPRWEAMGLTYYGAPSAP